MRNPHFTLIKGRNLCFTSFFHGKRKTWIHGYNESDAGHIPMGKTNKQKQKVQILWHLFSYSTFPRLSFRFGSH